MQKNLCAAERPGPGRSLVMAADLDLAGVVRGVHTALLVLIIASAYRYASTDAKSWFRSP